MVKNLKIPYEFDWDLNNLDKNWVKHAVHWKECESIFQNNSFVIVEDIQHSQYEQRFRISEVTKHGRFLYVIFTTRNNKIRIISARDQNKKERKAYFEALSN